MSSTPAFDADPHSGEALIESHRSLAGMVKRYQVRFEHMLPDLVGFQLALDVLEQTRAVAILTDNELGRPAIANARAAFESALDLMLLVSKADEYATMGALARASELVDAENLHSRRRKADDVLRLDRTVERASPEAIIEEEGAAWEEHRPGAVGLTSEALKRVRAEKLWKKHWSGLSRAQIRERIASVAPDPVGVSEMIDAMYGLQSAHAHPSARFGMRDITTDADGTLTIGPREVDVPAARGFATLALRVAALAVVRARRRI